MTRSKKHQKKKSCAICLHGLFNNRYSVTAGAEAYEELKSLINSFPEVDFTVFGFSSDLEAESEMRTLYQNLDARIVVEPQRDFELIIQEAGIDESRFPPPEKNRPLKNLLSSYYSRKRSIEMMQKFSSEQQQDFDWVIITRFDTNQIDRFSGRQRDKVSAVGFNLHLEIGANYSALWDQHNMAYADQWFIMNQKDASTLALMYDEALTYLVEGSAYLSHINSGILDSNQKNEFSNERLKKSEEKSKDLVRVSDQQALNSHLMHKHFFIETGMYENSKFTNNFENLPIVVFSHSEYEEISRVFFQALNQHFNCFPRRYLLADRGSEEIMELAELISYDPNVNYVDRLIQGLVQVPSDEIFFCHEDMIIIGQPNVRHFRDALNLIKTGKLDYFSFARGGLQIGLNMGVHKRIRRYVNVVSPWIFSLQPSIWNKSKLIELLRHHRGQDAWQFEARAQKTFRKLNLKGGFSSSRGKKRGSLHWETPLFPYIATAVVKGKLNWAEYPEEIEELVLSFGLDSNWGRAHNPSSG